MLRQLNAENLSASQMNTEQFQGKFDVMNREIKRLSEELDVARLETEFEKKKGGLTPLVSILSSMQGQDIGHAFTKWKIALVSGKMTSSLHATKRDGAWGALMRSLESALIGSVEQDIQLMGVRSFGLWRACVDETKQMVLIERIHELQGHTGDLAGLISAKNNKLASGSYQKRSQRYVFSNWLAMLKEGALRRLDRQSKYRQAEQYFVHLIGSRMRRLFTIWNTTTRKNQYHRLKGSLEDEMDQEIADRDENLLSIQQKVQRHHEKLAMKCYTRKFMLYGFGKWSRHTAGVMGMLSNKKDIENVLEQKKDLQYSFSDEVHRLSDELLLQCRILSMQKIYSRMQQYQMKSMQVSFSLWFRFRMHMRLREERVAFDTITEDHNYLEEEVRALRGESSQLNGLQNMNRFSQGYSRLSKLLDVARIGSVAGTFHSWVSISRKTQGGHDAQQLSNQWEKDRTAYDVQVRSLQQELAQSEIELIRLTEATEAASELVVTNGQVDRENEEEILHLREEVKKLKQMEAVKKLEAVNGSIKAVSTVEPMTEETRLELNAGYENAKRLEETLQQLESAEKKLSRMMLKEQHELVLLRHQEELKALREGVTQAKFHRGVKMLQTLTLTLTLTLTQIPSRCQNSAAGRQRTPAGEPA